MSEYVLVSDYKFNDKLRNSFNNLAQIIFDFSFETWYRAGHWNDTYICYSLLDDEKVIANVSVNKMSIVLNGEKKNAIQIGTVMTHPEYRGKGLAKELMELVLAKYEDESDFIYLFANKTVTEFYPKFGFQHAIQYKLSYEASEISGCKSEIRKLDIDNPIDMDLIKTLVSRRVPVSDVLGVYNDQSILTYYLMFVHRDNIYYLEGEDVILLFKQDSGIIDLYDVIASRRIETKKLCEDLQDGTINRIVFHFIPPKTNEIFKTLPFDDSNERLFIKSKTALGIEQFLFPATSKA